MNLFDTFIAFGVVGMIMAFADTKSFKEKRQGWPVAGKLWHHLKVSSFAVFGVFLAGAITVSLLIHYLFPEQDPYIFSGSPVTVLSYLFWGAIGIWVAMGRESSDSELDTDLSTSDARVGWLIEQPVKVGGALVNLLITPAKWLVIALAAIVVFVVIYVLGVQLEERLENMSTAKATVIAGVIIAAAIMAVGRKR